MIANSEEYKVRLELQDSLSKLHNIILNEHHKEQERALLWDLMQSNNDYFSSVKA